MLSPRVCLLSLVLPTIGCNTLIDKITGRGSEPAASAEVPAPTAAPTAADSVTVTGPGGKVVQVTGSPSSGSVTLTGPKGALHVTGGTTDAGTFAHVEGPHGGVTALATDGGARVQVGGQQINVQNDNKGGTSVSVGGKTIVVPPLPH